MCKSWLIIIDIYNFFISEHMKMNRKSSNRLIFIFQNFLHSLNSMKNILPDTEQRSSAWSPAVTVTRGVLTSTPGTTDVSPTEIM